MTLRARRKSPRRVQRTRHAASRASQRRTWQPCDVQRAACKMQHVCIQPVTLQHGARDEVLDRTSAWSTQGTASTSSPMLYSPCCTRRPPRSCLVPRWRAQSCGCGAAFLSLRWFAHVACCLLHVAFVFGSAAAFLSLRNDHQRTLGASGLSLANAAKAPAVPHLHWDWGRRLPCHICTGTGEGTCRATSALGLGKAPAVPHLHWDWGRRLLSEATLVVCFGSGSKRRNRLTSRSRRSGS